MLYQIGFFLVKSSHFGTVDEHFKPDRKLQARIDSILDVEQRRLPDEIRPVNPNFISDFKGYVLGMSPAEIDRLHRFRASGNFVQNAQHFQHVTGISDSLLNELAPAFRFPSFPQHPAATSAEGRSESQRKATGKKDLNKASAEELQSIRGIGKVLSARIVKFRGALGGFATEAQLYEVYGLDSAVVLRVLQQFAVIDSTVVHRLNINQATREELAALIYLSPRRAEQIISLRDSLGSIESFDQLTKIQDFPQEEIDRIKLYLTL